MTLTTVKETPLTVKYYDAINNIVNNNHNLDVDNIIIKTFVELLEKYVASKHPESNTSDNLMILTQDHYEEMYDIFLLSNWDFQVFSIRYGKERIMNVLDLLAKEIRLAYPFLKNDICEQVDYWTMTEKRLFDSAMCHVCPSFTGSFLAILDKPRNAFTELVAYIQFDMSAINRLKIAAIYCDTGKYNEVFKVHNTTIILFSNASEQLLVKTMRNRLETSCINVYHKSLNVNFESSGKYVECQTLTFKTTPNGLVFQFEDLDPSTGLTGHILTIDHKYINDNKTLYGN